MNDIYGKKASKYKYKYKLLKNEYIGGGDFPIIEDLKKLVPENVTNFLKSSGTNLDNILGNTFQNEENKLIEEINNNQNVFELIQLLYNNEERIRDLESQK